MKVEITKEGSLIVAKTETQEYAAKSAIQLIRLLVRAGMSKTQAPFVYVTAAEVMQA